MSSLTDRLSRVSRLNAVAIEERVRGLGITGSEGAVLTMLRREPTHVLAPSRLQGLVIQSPGGLTKTLRRLEGAGLVERRTDPGDRRALLVALTPTGTRVADEAVAAVEAHYDELLADLGAADREALAGHLGAVLGRLEAVTGKAMPGSTRVGAG